MNQSQRSRLLPWLVLVMVTVAGMALAASMRDTLANHQVGAATGSGSGSGGETGSGNYPCQGTVKVSSALNIRSAPWGTILGTFGPDAAVEVIGRKGDWYQIKWQGRTAYVHANYVETPFAPAGQTAVRRPGGGGNDPGGGGGHADPAPSPGGSGRFGAAPCTPMPGRLSSPFGMRRHPTMGTMRMHNGVDLPVPNGTRLNALGDGVVKAVGYESGGGRFLIIKYDNGLESFYCHLQSTNVRQGQRVSMGEQVAKSDNTGEWTTGAHLHMGIKRNGNYIDPKSVLRLP